MQPPLPYFILFFAPGGKNQIQVPYLIDFPQVVSGGIATNETDCVCFRDEPRAALLTQLSQAADFFGEISRGSWHNCRIFNGACRKGVVV